MDDIYYQGTFNCCHGIRFCRIKFNNGLFGRALTKIQVGEIPDFAPKVEHKDTIQDVKVPDRSHCHKLNGLYSIDEVAE